MKRTFITTGIIVAITVIALIIFNKLFSKKSNANIYEEVKKGTFEVTITGAGELIAEKSLDIMGPALAPNTNQGGDRGGGGRGGDFHIMDFKIQDIVPEGTIVKEGDYIAQLDRTSYDNTLKDALENLKTLQTNVEMKILDTTMTLTTLRDDIKNQRFAVEEAAIALDQSKFEPPAIIRQAEMNLDKAKRGLEQKIKGYELKVAQSLTAISHEKLHLTRGTALVSDLQDFLAQFTIKAPSSGMVTYKKDRLGIKRKSGSSINPFDRVIATLPDLTSMISKFYVSEIEVSKVKQGQKVTINVDALPDKAFTGTVLTVANIGEQLPNSDAKMFEVQIKVNESDPTLRPSMTTGNKIIINSYDNVIYIASECVQTGSDSIPFVYEKNKTKQIVVLGESNEKNVIVEQGLQPGNALYVITPEKPETFRMKGEELVPVIKEREKAKRAANNKYITKG